MTTPREPKKFVVRSSAWDDGDYIVSIRPEKAKPWLDVPIGFSMSKAEAERTARWLEGSIVELQKIILQTEQDHEV